MLTPSWAIANCHVGSYRLPDATVDIAPSDTGVRWRHVDGMTGKLIPTEDGQWKATEGWTDHPATHHVSLSTCVDSSITFDGVTGKKIKLKSIDTVFEGSNGTKLAGRLVLPEGNAQVPLVVLVHGAEASSALNDDFMQRQLPAEGVAAFVYDKRGTGSSGGQYTQNYDLLANDAVAAMREARRLGGSRIGRTGYRGGSQGGWVAPLAATKIPVDFVIVAYGLAVSPVEEDREAAILQLQTKGYGPDIIESALEIVDSAAVVARSQFTQGIEEFDRVRDQYKHEGWYKDVRGNFTYLMLPHMGDALRKEGQAFYYSGALWDYDAVSVLRKLRTEQLWQLAEADLDAPMAETYRRLRTLARKDHAPITVAVFPGAEHGMTLFEIDKNGERISTRYPQGYTRMTVDFAKGNVKETYGDSRIYKPD